MPRVICPAEVPHAGERRREKPHLEVGEGVVVKTWGWQPAKKCVMQECRYLWRAAHASLRCRTANLLEIRVNFLLAPLAAEVHCGACLGGRRGSAPASDVRIANFTL